MAFLKRASGVLVHQGFSPENWGNYIRPLTGKVASASTNLITQASEILQDTFDPNKYLLSHCTIVASVDVDTVSNVKTGSVVEDGQKILRKYSDYRITPKTEAYVNSNGDSWARGTLLKSYRTFVGAHNFLEHVQIEEQSKGRVIDAVARDIGDSIYIDILVATHVKHASLINDIKSGNLSTLSMGCSCVETTCTKCGNVATDDTNLCAHIRYEKSNHFYDDEGKRRVIAELCGHPTLDPTAGITFIEASWVQTPAFLGAVMRNILHPTALSTETQKQAEAVLSSPPPEWREDAHLKAASHQQLKPGYWKIPRTFGGTRSRTLVGQFSDEGESHEESSEPTSEEPKSGLADLESEIKKYLLDKVMNNIREELTTKVREEALPSDGELATSTGENVIRQAQTLFPPSSKRGGKMAHAIEVTTEALARIARSDVELIDNVARFHESVGIHLSMDLYRTALRVGSTDQYKSFDKYLAKTRKVLGRRPSLGEAKTLVRLGHILSLRKRTQST